MAKQSVLIDEIVIDNEPRIARSHRYITMNEVIYTWHCYRATVLRMISDGKLHPIEADGGDGLLFDRLEVLSLARTVRPRP